MTSLCTDQLRDSAPALPRFRVRTNLVQAARKTLATWQARRETRAMLAAMPDYLRRDIGLSVQEAIEESRKPFWKP